MPTDRLTPTADITVQDVLGLFDQTIAEELTKPRDLTKLEIDAELAHCKADVFYFITTYCYIYDSVSADWILFNLWPAQRQTLLDVIANKYTVDLKSRQQGISWLLGDVYPLWQMLFKPIAKVLIFSQRDDEAIKLLERLHDTYDRLPEWIKERAGIKTDSAHEFGLLNGSNAQALPGSAGGRSNAATYVLVDEADFIDDVGSLIKAARPTIDAGQNKMVVISTANIKQIGGYFQQLYTAARDNPLGKWKAIFLPWTADPRLTREWYDERIAEAMRTDGSLDGMYKEYPETDAQALSARSQNTRYTPRWIIALSHIMPGFLPPDAPLLPTLLVFKKPDPTRRYGIGLDPAGGMADSDESVATVVDAETNEQCAVLAGKVEPTEFANQSAEVSFYYNNAPILFELNNHGYAVLAQLKERNVSLRMGIQRDGSKGKPGWFTTERSKGKLYDTGGKVLQAGLKPGMDEKGEINASLLRPIIHDARTQQQLLAVDVNTLKAPEGGHDDRATAWALAQECIYQGTSSMSQERVVGLYPKRDEEMIPPRRSAAPVRNVVKAEADESRRQEWERGEKESMEDWTGRIRYKTSERFKN